MFRTVFLFSLVALLFLSLPSDVQAKRVALIIGNSVYEHAPALPNPANDAADVANAFSDLGYDVKLVEDASRESLLDALRLFRYQSLGAEHSVIYYAGHGVEIDRQNFLVPVDAELKSDIDVEYEAISLNLLVVATSGATNLQLVVLDACRDNPFLEQMTRTVATRSIGRGLALFEPTGNSLVAYSAKEGTVALDGSGTNSPYAEAFLSALEKPKLEVGQFFRQVRDSVIRTTNSKQEPFLYGSLSSEPVFFRPMTSNREINEVAIAPAQQDKISKDTLVSIDLSFWESIRSSDQPTDFQDYLEKFPEGQFRSLAQRRFASLASIAIPQTEPKATKPVAVPEPSLPPEIRLSRNQARDLQARLNMLGFNAGGEDGLIGRRTLLAVAAFRTSVAAVGDSRIDLELLDRLKTVVPDSRLTAYREKAQSPTPATRKSERKTTIAPDISSTKLPTRNLSAFNGQTYCLKRKGMVENGLNGAWLPINCYKILDINKDTVRYSYSERKDSSDALDTSTITARRSGERTYGQISLPASGAGFIQGPPGNSVYVSSIMRR